MGRAREGRARHVARRWPPRGAPRLLECRRRGRRRGRVRARARPRASAPRLPPLPRRRPRRGGPFPRGRRTPPATPTRSAPWATTAPRISSASPSTNSRTNSTSPSPPTAGASSSTPIDCETRARARVARRRAVLDRRGDVRRVSLRLLCRALRGRAAQITRRVLRGHRGRGRVVLGQKNSRGETRATRREETRLSSLADASSVGERVDEEEVDPTTTKPNARMDEDDDSAFEGSRRTSPGSSPTQPEASSARTEDETLLARWNREKLFAEAREELAAWRRSRGGVPALRGGTREAQGGGAAFGDSGRGDADGGRGRLGRLLQAVSQRAERQGGQGGEDDRG